MGRGRGYVETRHVKGADNMLIHLHWSRNPKLVRETTRGITLCNQKVPHDELTAFDADATCPQCRARAGLKTDYHGSRRA
jgi:hypothetical protein